MINNEKNKEQLNEELKLLDEKKNRLLMQSVWILLLSNLLFFGGIITLASIFLGEGVEFGIVMCASLIIFIGVCFYAVKLEREAGYYECPECHHYFIPKYIDMIMSPHIHTTRLLMCPECHNKSWCKKKMKKN